MEGIDSDGMVMEIGVSNVAVKVLARLWKFVIVM